jgi:hypothetical protein
MTASQDQGLSVHISDVNELLRENLVSTARKYDGQSGPTRYQDGSSSALYVARCFKIPPS